MQPNGKGEVCAEEIMRVINVVLRGRRRLGIPPGVCESDLRQEAALSVFERGATEPALVAKIARDAMIDCLRRSGREEQIEVDAHGVVNKAKRSKDVFFALPVDDGAAYRPKFKQRLNGPVETLAARHAEWEREHAEVWA